MELDSANSSPGTASQSQSQSLLQLFQNSKSRPRGASKTPQPPFQLSSSPQEPSDVNTNDQPSKIGMSASQPEPPITRKRLCSSPAMDTAAENEESDGEIPDTLPRKRTRQTVSDKVKPINKKQAAAQSKQVQVQVQVPKQANPPQQSSQQPEKGRKTSSGALQAVSGNTNNKQAIQASTTSMTAAHADGLDTSGLFVKETVPTSLQQEGRNKSMESNKAFATKILGENQKLAETLNQKNQNFLNDMPAAARSYLEAQLVKATAEVIQLHQEKVDAVRLGYVAELQRDMSERQKVIDMLLKSS